MDNKEVFIFNIIMFISIMLSLGIVVDKLDIAIASTRVTGIQCNKYHDYGNKIDKLKTYEEVYPNDS